MSLIIVCFSFPFCLGFIPKTQKARPVKVWLGEVDDSLAVVVGSGSEFLRLFLNCERFAGRNPVQGIFNEPVLELCHG
jgi:hypothetical protein